MSFIQPSGQVEIFEGYNGDKGYNHFVLVGDSPTESERDAWFAELLPPMNDPTYGAFVLKEQKYCRYTNNSIRVGYPADYYYRCNYMRFRNVNQGNKWFYAFIDKVEYVNNNMCEIFYTIDVLQTWWFDWDFGECFVEREHTLTDGYGENVVEEDLEYGDYITADSSTMSFNKERSLSGAKNGLMYVVFSTKGRYAKMGEVGITTFSLPKTTKLNGIVVPYYVTIAGEGAITDVLNWYRGDEQTGDITSAIVATYSIRSFIEPNAFYCLFGETEGAVPFNFAERWSLFLSARDNLFGGYVPKNKKLFQSPYYNIDVSNNDGKEYTYNPIFFAEASNPSPVYRFWIYHSLGTKGESVIVPIGYKGQDVYYEGVVPFSSYPVYPINTNVYNQYLLENKNQINQSITNTTISSLLNYGGALAGVVGGAAMGNPMAMVGGVVSAGGAVAGYYQNIANIDAKKKDLQSIPDQTRGFVGFDGTLMNPDFDKFGFTIYFKTIHREYAKIVDNFFTMFGYAIKEVKLPILKSDEYELARPIWNYLKTQGCIIKSKSNGKFIPSSDAELIKQIFDKGITVWKTNDVGNYSADNYPQMTSAVEYTVGETDEEYYERINAENE